MKRSQPFILFGLAVCMALVTSVLIYNWLQRQPKVVEKVIGTQSDTYANGFSSTACTSAQLGPYLNGSKNLTFAGNTYRVPSLTGRYWVWGPVSKYWNEWQALRQDLDGTVSQ